MCRIIPLSETISTEFKSDRNCLPDSEILDVVVALANTDGGELYLGVEDDGTLTGIHPTHQDITRLSAFIANHTVPPVSTRVEMIDDLKPVIKISVPKSVTGIIATASGKVLRRRIKADGTPESVPMYPAEQTSRLSDLRLVDHSSIVLTEATLDDFDPLELVRLRNMIQSYDGEKNLLALSDIELFQALGLSREYAGQQLPTLTGLLLLGHVESLKKFVPTHRTSFQALTGTKVRINDDFVLPILASIEKLSTYMDAWNPDNEIELGMFRIAAPDFDKRAVREAIVNAFSHRDYTRLGRVRVAVHDDGLTVANPGGFIEGVHLKNLLTVEPHGRNPSLADALKRIGLAERTGRGIDRIYEGSLKFGRLLPDFSGSTDVNVSLLLPRSKPDLSLSQLIVREQNRLGRPLSVNTLMMLNTLRNHPKVDVMQLIEYTQLPESIVQRELEQLASHQLIEVSHVRHTEAFSLVSPVSKANVNLKYARKDQYSVDQRDDLILRHARENQSITRSDVASLLQVSNAQAYLLLKQLADRGELVLVGKGRYAKYQLPT